VGVILGMANLCVISTSTTIRFVTVEILKRRLKSGFLKIWANLVVFQVNGNLVILLQSTVQQIH